MNPVWYQKSLSLWMVPLIPFSWLFLGIVWLKSQYERRTLRSASPNPIPLIVVGNLTVGGTGKTPLIIALAQYFKDRGLRVGVISRGYGGQHRCPTRVDAHSTAQQVGDEALMIYQRVQAPMVVGRDRVAALQQLLDMLCSDKPWKKCLDESGAVPLDVVLSDDGLQHGRLQRQVEIVVIDAERLFGNGYCLPAGPLREPLSRLATVDFLVYNHRMAVQASHQHADRAGRDAPVQVQAETAQALSAELIQPQAAQSCTSRPGQACMYYQLSDLYSAVDPTKKVPLSAFKGKQVHVVLGLGYPQPLLAYLEGLGLLLKPHVYPDHYVYQAADLDFEDDCPVLLTEKDVVKCRAFVDQRHWVLAIDACVEPDFYEQVYRLTQEYRRG